MSTTSEPPAVPEAAARPVEKTPYYCTQPVVAEPVLPAGIEPGRARLIRLTKEKWQNGSTIRYYLFDKASDGEHVSYTDGTTRWLPWKAPDKAHENAVRNAFAAWKNLGIGLRFEEVKDRKLAQVRIAFAQNGRSWSYLGRGVLDHDVDEPTMNLGWDLTDSYGFDTAVHEIGHTLGFPHEHQNPFSGIVWNRNKVMEDLGGYPNYWKPEEIEWNILRKIEQDEVTGSSWDPNSIMHYSFKAGLIEQPEIYRDGLQPKGGLSDRDKAWAHKFYPAFSAANAPALKTFQSVELVGKAPSAQIFTFTPDSTRDYEIRTLGTADTFLVVSEDNSGNPIELAADNDSGDDRNALIRLPLVAGRKYVIQSRLVYTAPHSSAAIIVL